MKSTLGYNVILIYEIIYIFCRTWCIIKIFGVLMLFLSLLDTKKISNLKITTSNFMVKFDMILF